VNMQFRHNHIHIGQKGILLKIFQEIEDGRVQIAEISEVFEVRVIVSLLVYCKEKQT
jgi:hypothetical protein